MDNPWAAAADAGLAGLEAGASGIRWSFAVARGGERVGRERGDEDCRRWEGDWPGLAWLVDSKLNEEASPSRSVTTSSAAGSGLLLLVRFVSALGFARGWL